MPIQMISCISDSPTRRRGANGGRSSRASPLVPSRVAIREVRKCRNIVFAYDCGNLSEGDARTMLLDRGSVPNGMVQSACACCSLLPSGSQRRRNIRNRPEQDHRVIPRWQEAPARPEFSRVVVNRIHHQRPASNQRRRFDAAFQSMSQQACAHTLPHPIAVRRQLPKQQIRNGIARFGRNSLDGLASS